MGWEFEPKIMRVNVLLSFFIRLIFNMKYYKNKMQFSFQVN